MKLNRSKPEEPAKEQKPKLNRLASTPTPIVTSHWDIITLSENTCFVCDKQFKKGANIICIGKKDGISLNRHARCDCFSEKWKAKFNGCPTLINHNS